MTLFQNALIALVIAAVPISAGQAQTAAEHTQWCLTGDATNMLKDQPLDRGICGGLLAGSVVAVIAGVPVPPEVFATTQGEWSRSSAPLACSPSPASQYTAVAAIIACQCHNPQAMEAIKNNPGAAISTMKKYAGCN